MVMPEKNVTLALVERTLENLKFIQEQKNANANVYEVTQLINSMLGLLIFPKEKQNRQNPDDLYVKIDNSFVSPEILGRLKDAIDNDPKKSACDNDKARAKYTLCKIIRHLRNAIAHYRITLIPAKIADDDNNNYITRIIFEDKNQRTNDITGIIFEDENPRSKTKKLFKLSLDIELLNDFVKDFAGNFAQKLIEKAEKLKSTSLALR